MSTLDERIEDAYCEDSVIALEAQRELVADVLARRLKPRTERLCPTCLHELDEAAYCTCCGHLEYDRAPAPDLSEPRAGAQKEGD